MASFIGLKPFSTWPEIEFETAGGLIDLHNMADLGDLTISPQRSTLTIRFVHYGKLRGSEAESHAVELEFGGIRDLKMELPADYEPRAAETLEGIAHREISGQSYFDIDMGDVKCTLAAETLTLRVSELGCTA
ncbi:hypothetical protein SMD20_22975 [Nonomuraea sp. LP-02]|uniref:hypothetical protein n=1 Tax=Nonomuraea sp. LP-02 TaxID=3097960 RepID=UPI002E31F662|nr:hypothetical protein [Nonomuraea sp. LP-02]MED7927138.1 hypothetical protein [Nonomuraea sp. LP-02]